MGMGMGHWWQQIFGDQDVIDSIHGFKVQYDDAHVSRLSSIYTILTMVNIILTMVNTIFTMVNIL